MNKGLPLLAVCIAAFATAISSGQVVPVFENIDRDDDGFIGLLEARESGNSTLKKYFKKIDSNKDGKVTPVEFRKLKTAVASNNKKERAAREAAKKRQLQQLRERQRRNRNRVRRNRR